MKGRFLFVLFFLGMAISAFAQEESDPVRVHLRRTVPWQKSYSVEIGTGIPPIHMIMFPTYEVERALAEKGQEANLEGAIHPVVSLSGVYRVREASELLLTVGVSCCYYDITQYAVFGTDPDGNPRYDLEKGAYAGRIRSDLSVAVTFQYRHIWNPGRLIETYSDLSLGITDSSEWQLLPGVTFFGLRYGGRHLYAYVENTISPVATLVHGGLGWRF